MEPDTAQTSTSQEPSQSTEAEEQPTQSKPTIQTPTPPQSDSQQSPEISQATDEPKSKRKVKIFLAIIIALLLITIFGTTWALAYEKIKLEKYPEFQRSVSHFVQSLPLMPKTPKFLIEKSIQAQKTVGKLAFDISAAFDSPDLVSSLDIGLSKLDLEAKGAVDYSNPKSPTLDLNASLTKDLNFELKTKDQMFYFRINKVPAFLLSLVGINLEQVEPLLNVWVVQDISPLNTEARKKLEEEKEVEQITTKYLEDIYEKYIDEEVLSKMSTSKEKLDGHNVYKVKLTADASLIDHIGRKIEGETRKTYGYEDAPTEQLKLSDFLKKLEIEIFVDRGNYYIRKFTLLTDLETENTTSYGSSYQDIVAPFSALSEGSFALSVSFSDFNKDVAPQIPTDYITFEEFTQKVAEITGGFYNTTSTGDSRKMADIAQIGSALELFYADCNKYPTNLSSTSSTSCTSLTPDYLLEVPKDPDGIDYYYKSDGKTYDLCAKVENETYATGNCPNSEFNLHVTNP
jgi:hypothetical protein